MSGLELFLCAVQQVERRQVILKTLQWLKNMSSDLNVRSENLTQRFTILSQSNQVIRNTTQYGQYPSKSYTFG